MVFYDTDQSGLVYKMINKYPIIYNNLCVNTPFVYLFCFSITTEDKYGTTPINSACGTDEDEEFLKSNETMKDLTPPKLTPAVQSPSVSSNSTAAKQLYTSSPPNIKPDFKTEIKQELKAESSELQQRNGLVAVSSTETKASM